MAGFHDIIGHEKIKEHLQKAIGYQRVSHAYLHIVGRGRNGTQDDREGICHDAFVRETWDGAVHGMPFL